MTYGTYLFCEYAPLKGLSSEMEWGMKVVSIRVGVPLNNEHRRIVFLFSKGTVSNLHLKFEAPKQHFTCQGARHFLSVVFLVCSFYNKS